MKKNLSNKTKYVSKNIIVDKIQMYVYLKARKVTQLIINK